MPKHIHVELPDDQHARLEEFKDKHGLTWKGVLLRGTPEE